MNGTDLTVLILILVFLYNVSSFRPSDVCTADDKECNKPNVAGLGELMWGECSNNGILLRYDKLSLIECAKECLLTAQCISINYRMNWKVCDLVGAFKNNKTANMEPGCLNSLISTWDKSIAGDCSEHTCQAGTKCKFNPSNKTTYCYNAYCTDTLPIIPNSEVVAVFGSHRNFNRANKHVCTNGYIMCGAPFVICRATNKWEVLFSCIPDQKDIEKYRSRCYRLSNSRKTWENAKIDCEKGNMSLAAINSNVENIWLTERMTSKYGSEGKSVYLGGKRLVEDVFVWIGVSDIQTPMSYLNWASEEPNDNNGNEDCLTVRPHSGKWNDKNCKFVLYYICKV